MLIIFNSILLIGIIASALFELKKLAGIKDYALLITINEYFPIVYILTILVGAMTGSLEAVGLITLFILSALFSYSADDKSIAGKVNSFVCLVVLCYWGHRILDLLGAIKC